MDKLVTIGDAAKITGVTAKMIRHYEATGLLQRAVRTEAGYRLYDQKQLQQLNFIRQARKLGFSIEQIHSLLRLWRDPARASRDVKQVAEEHLDEINGKIRELQQMQGILQQLVNQCCGDETPDCAILDGLGASSEGQGRQ